MLADKNEEIKKTKDNLENKIRDLETEMERLNGEHAEAIKFTQEKEKLEAQLETHKTALE